MEDKIFTASVISYNCFENIMEDLQKGVMETHEWIRDFAIEFEDEFGHIDEWDIYLYENHKDIDDWEEFLIRAVWDRILIEKI